MRRGFFARNNVVAEVKLEQVGEAATLFLAVKDRAEMFTNQPSLVYAQYHF